jgi:hypothetical protein
MKVKLKLNFVRDGNQPPTPQTPRAAIRPLTDTSFMKNKTSIASLLALLLCAGCQTPVAVTADYGLPGTNITATVAIGTNAVTIGGAYQAGTTNIGGTVTVGK